jgi:methyltransferase (TIGR00027 family)
MASRESLSGLSRTALGMARVRAAESRRPDRLFDDPYAQAFVQTFPEEKAITAAVSSLGAAFSLHGVIRTRFFDDHLLGAANAGCSQVVLLAAGLDTRAFRLAWPAGVRLFEIDLPEMVELKERVLAAHQAVPRCRRTVVPADLREDWLARLTANGFQRTRPTAWLAEGLLIYLSADQAASLLTEVGQLSVPASQVAFEHGTIAGSPLLSRARATPAMDELTRLWKGGLGADAPDWLVRRGWRVEIHDRAALAAAYGRAAPGASRGGFVTAVRTEGMRPAGS